MPNFWYKEIGKGEKVQEGYIEAKSEKEVIKYIKSRGKTPVSIKMAKQPNEKGKKSKKVETDISSTEDGGILNKEIEIEFLQPKVKLRDIAVMCRQMGTMLISGMDLIRTVEVLTQQSEHATLKKTLKNISVELRKGYMLSVTLRAYPKVFPELLLSMVEAGELTGTLDQVMESMAVHYKKEDKITRQIRGAMMYPIVLAIAAILVVTALLVFVMPVFIEMFDGMPLPVLTQMVLDVSNSIKKYWYLYLLVIFSISFFNIFLMKKKKIRYNVHKLVSNIPVLGKALSKISAARFCRTLATLLSSGIPIVRSLEASAKVTNNEYLIQEMDNVVEEIKKGRFLNILLRELDFFPPMVVSMIAIGEESGDMEMMLERTADYYDDEMEAIINELVNAIQPIMIIIMAVVVGIIVIAMFLPILDSMSHLQDSLQ